MDYISLQKTLAENKVYDAWQYVESLVETLRYMNISAALVSNVYNHRKSVLEEGSQEILRSAISNGTANITEETLNATNLQIANLEIDDIIFLKKTAIEFIHYARMSMDILFQIINASLLGDSAYDVEDKALIRKLLLKLDSTADFATLKSLIETNKDNDKFKYLQAFDNHVKHIKTILLNVKNSFLIGNSDVFKIDTFSYGGDSYPSCDAVQKITEIEQYVQNTIENILVELQLQIPNCIDNQKRVHNLHFKMQIQESDENSNIEHITFFIYVDNDISDLPNEINVLPLIIKSNNDIYHFDFRLEEIFIKKKGTEEVLGIAKLKNGLDNREVYRTYTVSSCGMGDLFEYYTNFKAKYPTINMNFAALEGSIVSYKL